MEEMEVFRLFEGVADWAWDSVARWPKFAQDALGRQLVTAIDSVNANLVEGDGRYTDPDALRFFVIARASAREARLWIRRAIKRNLVSEVEGQEQIERIHHATRLLNNLMKYRRKSTKSAAVREEVRGYSVGTVEADPFLEEEMEDVPAARQRPHAVTP